MRRERLPTRDVREDRFEREEKLGQALETLPGKTLRDRLPNSRETNAHAERRSVKAQTSGLPIAWNQKLPVVVPHRSIWFRLDAPAAERVCVAGTFNEWNPTATPLVKSKEGEWRTEKNLALGEYEYRFVVDGIWQDDPNAKHTVPNPFGSRNSVIQVA